MTSPAQDEAHDPERSDPSLEVVFDSGETRTSMPAELPALGRIGRYELLGRMAVGGMAEIYLARERATAGGSRHLVVKVIRSQLESEGDYEIMFLNEGRLALRLNHPNICHLYEFGSERGRIFIAMELVHGVSLNELVRRAAREKQRVPMPILVRIASQVAEALHSAHAATGEDGRPLDIVHRDVSPHNVMVSYEGVVKLLDFGVAMASNELGDIEESGTIKGKFGYLAPEQCLGEPVDARADIFSLGVCLWEGLTGRRLFKRGGEYETLHAIVREDTPRPADLGVEVPAELEAIVARALAKKPADRFQTAAEMQEALEAFLTERRELVNAPRITRYLSELYGDEIERGPQLDCRPQLFEWAAPLEPAPREEAPEVPARSTEAPAPARPRRGAWSIAAVLSLIAAVGIGWQLWGGARTSEPEPAVPEVEVDRVAAAPRARPVTGDAPPESTAPAEPVEPVDEPSPERASPEVEVAPDAEEVADDEADEESETEAQRRRRARRALRERVRSGDFVEDPGF